MATPALVSGAPTLYG
ncbi:transglycosylase family protein, partial [Yersinia pestis PY-99]